MAGVRGKEREAAPHLGTGSTSRMGMQPQASNAASRRAETREAAKKKAGEASEDWRRGGYLFMHHIYIDIFFLTRC